MTALGSLLMDVQPGFACGAEDPNGIFQFRMHNVSKASSIVLAHRRRVPSDAHQNMRRFILRAGDVLFNATNSPDGVGKSVLVPELDEPAVFSNHFLRLRTDPDRLDSRFLWRWLQFRYAEGLFVGMCKQWVNQATVDRGRLLAVPLLPPPLDDQRRIVAILDKADEIRTKRREALAHLDKLAAALFSSMFSSSGWPQAPLSGVVRSGTDVTYGIVQAGEEFPSGVPYIRTGDIVGGRIRRSGLRRTDPAIAAKFDRSRVDAGDIVMSIRATVGTTAVVPDELDGANLTQGTARIAPGDGVIGPYLLQYLRSAAAQSWIQAQVKGATFREITLTRLRDLAVSLPPVDLQSEFAAHVERIETQRAAVERALAADDELFASLQSRAFRGEL